MKSNLTMTPTILRVKVKSTTVVFVVRCLFFYTDSKILKNPFCDRNLLLLKSNFFKSNLENSYNFWAAYLSAK